MLHPPRFIYVRHGSGLVKEGVRLLHIASTVFVLIYMVNRWQQWH